MPRRVIGLVLAVSLAACGGGGAGAASDDPSGGTAGGEQGSSAETAEESGAELELASASAKVTWLDWGDGDRMLVGFSNGSFAAIDPATSRYEYYKVTKNDFPIEAIAPSGNFALIGSTPPAVLAKDGTAVLQMNPVKNYSGASFARDNLGIYVSDHDGNVRIWGQEHSFEDELSKEKLEDYLNRQAPDFKVQFAPLEGPLNMTTDGVLLIGAKDGTISMWSMQKVSSSKRIMKLDAPVERFDAAGGVIVATSTEGQLKVGTLDPPSYKAWSREAKADFADVSNLLTDQFVSQTGSTVALRDVESGDAVWSVELPGSKACGVAVSANARRIAACVDDNIVVLDAENGQARSHAWHTGSGIGWKTPGGKDISP